MIASELPLLMMFESCSETFTPGTVMAAPIRRTKRIMTVKTMPQQIVVM